MLPATFSIPSPFFNSLNLFKKLCPTLATSPRTLPNASIELPNQKQIHNELILGIQFFAINGSELTGQEVKFAGLFHREDR